MTDLTHKEQAEKILDELDVDDASAQLIAIAQVEATLALVNSLESFENSIYHWMQNR